METLPSDHSTLENSPARPSRRLSRWWVIGSFIVLFVVALFLDIPLSSWAHDSGLAPFMKRQYDLGQKIRLGRITLYSYDLSHTIRLPGNFLFTCFAAIVLLVRDHPQRRLLAYPYWRDSAIVFLAGVLSGINAVFKWAIGRTRPFHGVGPFVLHPFKGGWHGQLLAEQNLSFPSGDASIAFATAASLSMVAPKGRWIWWFFAAVVACERVAENAHYPSDTIAGAALGIGVAYLSCALIKRLTRLKVFKDRRSGFEPLIEP